MGFAKIKGKLSSRIGRRVNFGVPQDVKAKGGLGGGGTIVDEAWVKPEDNEAPPHPQPCTHGSHCWGDYSFCSQLIKWDDDDEKVIRFAYYRRRCGEDFWEFASQMTVTAEPKTAKALCERTLGKESWFRTEPAPDSIPIRSSPPECVALPGLPGS